jgi:Xaa-Pro aminopeptidase
MDIHGHRRNKLSHAVKQQGLHGFLVTNPFNVSYLTGFSGEASYLLVGAEKDYALLVSDGRFTAQLQEECPGLELFIRLPSQRITIAAIQVLETTGWKSIGCESSHLTVAEFEEFSTILTAAQWKPQSGVIEQFRARKDQSEIAEIKDAIGMAERALKKFLKSLSPKDSEKQLTDRMEMLLREEGATHSSFPTIVAAGVRAALPHAPPTPQSLGGQELVLIDWGASGIFYKSDLTRTYAIGKPTDQFRKVHDAVLKAQQRAIAAIKPGVQAQAVDAEARKSLQETGYLEYFKHGLGHGLGINVHELPFLRPGQDTVLEPGMVVTVEPGVYLPEWGGIRIEDDVLVTANGAEVLTHVPRDIDSLVISL